MPTKITIILWKLSLYLTGEKKGELARLNLLIFSVLKYGFTLYTSLSFNIAKLFEVVLFCFFPERIICLWILLLEGQKALLNHYNHREYRPYSHFIAGNLWRSWFMYVRWCTAARALRNKNCKPLCLYIYIYQWTAIIMLHWKSPCKHRINHFNGPLWAARFK